MQAIQVKYLAPTNNRGSRLKASCDAGNVTISWDYRLSIEENDDAAFKALIQKLGWTKNNGYTDTWSKGSLDKGDVTVYTMANCEVFTQ